MTTGPEAQGQPVWVAEAKVSRVRDEPHYPKTGTHVWGAFAFLALELDGYGNVEVVDPYTGRVLWVPEACGDRERGRLGEMISCADMLRRVADAIEAHGFLPDEEEPT